MNNNDFLNEYIIYLNENENNISEAGAGVSSVFKAINGTLRTGEKKLGRAVISSGVGKKVFSSKPVKTMINTKFFSKYGVEIGEAAMSGMNFTIYLKSIEYSYKLGNDILHSANRKCGVGNYSPGRQLCVSKEIIKGCDLKMKALRELSQKCNNPECKEKISNEMQSLNAKKLKAQNAIKRLNSDPYIEESVVIDELLNEGIGNIADSAFRFYLGAQVMTLVDDAMWATWRLGSSIVDKATRDCGVLKKGLDRELCMSSARLNAYTTKRKVLIEIKGKCSHSKDPKKCLSRINKSLIVIDKKIERETYNVKYYMKNKLRKKMEHEAFKNM